MKKNRKIAIAGNTERSVIISGDNNVVLFSNPSPPLEIGMVPETHHIDNPYLGISFFSEKDADRFFGRDKLIDRIYGAFFDLFEQLSPVQKTTRVLSILGPSGSGKSSVVRAGFLAELARRSIHGYKNIRTAIITPGSRPIEQLAGVFARVDTDEHSRFKKIEEFETRLKEPSKKGSYNGLRFIVDHLPGIDQQPFILIVDQFEELFDRCKQEADRSAFIENVLHAAGDPGHRVFVILVMRSDFLDAVSHYEKLSCLMSEQAVLVPAMTTEELEAAITEPAADAGRPIDPATVEILLAQCIEREGVLPRLQITLEQIWDGMLHGRTPRETLSALGGVGGSLGAIAQKIYDPLSIGQQEIAKCAFLAMVQSGENRQWTRRRVAVSELVDTNRTKDQVMDVLRRFAERGKRLLSLSGDSDGEVFVEVVHEALFKNWSLLNDWLQDLQPLITLHRRLNETARDWQDKGRPSGLLWRSPAVEEMERLSNHPFIIITQADQAFIDASQWAQKRRIRARRMMFGMSIAAAVLMTLLALFSYTKKNEADREKRVAQQQKEEAREQTKLAIARQLAAQSSQILSSEALKTKDLEKAALLAIESLKQAQTVEGYHAWEHSVLRLPAWEQRYKYDGDIGSLTLSPDGKHLLTTLLKGVSKASGKAYLWDVQSETSILQVDHNGGIADVVFSPNNDFFATASWDRTVSLYNLVTGKLVKTIRYKASVIKVLFSPDNKNLAAVLENGSVKLYSLGDMQELFSVLHKDGVTDALITPDNRFLVTAGKNQSVVFWNLQTGERSNQYKHDSVVVRILVTPDSKMLVIQYKDGKTPRVWNIKSQKVIYHLKHPRDVFDIAISPDGNSVVTVIKGQIKVWDVKSGTEKDSCSYDPPYYSGSIAVNHNAERISILAGDPIRPMIWRHDTEEVKLTLEHPKAECLAFTPNGLQVATAGRDHCIRLWDAVSGKEIRQLSHKSEVTSLKFSNDGTKLSYVVDDSPFSVRYSWSETVMIDLVDGVEKLRFAGHPAHTSSIRYSPDGHRIITGSWDGTVRFWDAINGIENKRLVETGPVVDVAFNHDGKRIFTQVVASPFDYAGNYFQEGHTWDVETLKRKTIFPLPGGIVLSHLMMNERNLWTAGTDATIRLWDLNSGDEIRRTSIPTKEKAKAFHPDGDSIATVDTTETGKVIIRDLSIGKKQSVLKHEKPVGRIVFSPDGATLVAEISGQQELWVWDLKTAKPLCRIANPEDIDKVQRLQSWKVNSDGSLLSTSDLHGTVRIWNPRNGNLISELQHPRPVSQRGFFILASVFSGDGKRLITQSGRSIIVWDPLNGRQLGRADSVSDLLNIETSADGRMFRTFDKEGIKIWDTTSCKLKFHFKLDIGRSGIYSFFSLDSRLVCAPIGDKLHVWRIETGEQMAPIKLSGDIVGHIHMLSDIDLLITENSAGRICGQFLSTGAHKYTIGHSAAAQKIDVKPEAGMAVCANGGMAETYELRNGTQLAAFSYTDGMMVHRFSPDGTRLVTSPVFGNDEQLIDIWDAASGKKLNTISDQSELSDSFNFSSKGDMLAIPDRGGAVHIWDMENFKKLVKLQIKSRVRHVRFSPDDRLLAIDTDEHQIQVWDWRAGSKIIQFPVTGGLERFVFSKDSHRIITGNREGVIRVWEITKPGIRQASLKHEKNVSKIVSTPDGRLMATYQGYKDIDYITVWDVAKGRECYRIYHAIDNIVANQSASQSPQTYSNKKTKGYFYDIAFSPDGRILATAGADGKIKLWRSNDGRKITQWKYQYRYPKVAFSRDGKLLTVHTSIEEKEQGYRRNRDLVVIRSAEDGYRKISKIEGYFSKVRMTKDGRKIVTAEGKIEQRLTKMTDHRPISDPPAFWGIRVWDATTGNELLSLPHQRAIQNVAINHKGDVMGSHFYGEGFLRFFDTLNGKIIKEIPDNGDSSGHSILFSPDDSAVAIISYKNIVVWDTETWQVIDRISPADSIDRFRSQFSPVRNFLAWKSGKGKIWIWDWVNDRKIAVINANIPYGPFLFSPDEKYLISADDQGHVNFFLWRNKDLVADACRRLEHNLSEQDWQTYMGTIPYEPTCLGLPAADNR